MNVRNPDITGPCRPPSRPAQDTRLPRTFQEHANLPCFNRRGRFFKHASHVVAGACGKSRQIALLPGAGLIGGGDPAIKGRLLSQLNSPRLAGSKSLIPCGRAPYRTAFTLSGTIRYAETPCADHHTARRAV